MVDQGGGVYRGTSKAYTQSGSFNYAVEAWDNRDNYRRDPASGDRSVQITVDTTPPTISGVSASVDTSGRVTVQATVTDSGTGVKSVKCSYQGPGDWVRESFDMVDQGGGVYRGTSKAYTQSGSFNYAVEAWDNRDNYRRDPASGDRSVQITVDTTPPTISGVSASVDTSGRVTVQATVTDSGTGVKSVKCSYQGPGDWVRESFDMVDQGGGVYRGTSKAYTQSGSFNYAVEAWDNRDNYRRDPASGDRSVQITVDTTPPTISGVSASVDTSGRVTVQATVTDSGTGVKSVKCSYQGPGDWVRESFDMVDQGGGVYRGTSKAYTQSGSFNYAVEAWDNRDNYRRDPASGDRSVQITVDTTPPTISGVSASVDTSGRVTVQATVTDSGTGVKSVKCSYQGPGDWVRESFDMVDQGGGVYRGTSKAYTQSGSFNYAVEAWDNRDNYRRDPASGDRSVQITVDTTPPTISGVSASVDTSGRVTVQATVTDSGTGVKSVKCSYQGPGDWVRESFDMVDQGGGVYRGTSKAYTQSGSFNYAVEAWDNRDNYRRDPASGDRSVQITVDTTPPTISGVSASVDTSGRVTVQATVTDSGTGVKSVKCSYQGPGDWVRESFDMVDQGGGVYRGTSKAYTQSGSFNYAVEAWDNRDNYRRDPASGDRSVQITVDKPDLIVESVKPSNSTPSENEEITVEAVVKNIGSADAKSFSVDLFKNLDTPPTPQSNYDIRKTVNSLKAGSPTTLKFTNVSYDTPGTYKLWVLADSLGQIDEGQKEDNNYNSLSIEVKPTLPEINVKVGGTSIADNVGSYDFGSVNLGSSKAVTFTIGNTGNAMLNLMGSPLIRISGTNASEFVVTQQPSASVSASGSTTFSITFTSGGAGARSASVNIDNNDPDENPFDFMVSGTGVEVPKPDLIVDSVTPSNPTPFASDKITITAVVRNIGNADAKSFSVGLFKNLNTPPTPQSNYDIRKTVNSLKAGLPTTLKFTNVSYDTPGTYKLWVLADSMAQIDEGENEGNNYNSLNIEVKPVPKPDLIVDSVIPSNPTPSVGDKITITAVVKNNGAAAKSFSVDLYKNLDNPPSAPSTGDMTKTVRSLAANSSTSLTFTNVSYDRAGTKQLWVLADSTAQVDEGEHENNNYRGLNIDVKPAITPKPDLIVESVTPSNPAPSVGDKITITAVVRNIGDATAKSFSVDLYKDLGSPPQSPSTGEMTKAVTSLKPSSSTTIKFTNVSYDQAGMYTLWVLADSSGQVDEGENEGNNCKGVDIEVIPVLKPDLVVEKVAVSNYYPRVGENVTVEVIIKNRGSAPAKQFSVNLYVDRDKPPSAPARGNVRENVDFLGEGTRVGILFNASYRKSGNYKLWILADSKKQLNEINKVNNYGPRDGANLIVTDEEKDVRITKLFPNRMPAIASQRSFLINTPPIEGSATIASGTSILCEIRNDTSEIFEGLLRVRQFSPDGTDHGYQKLEYAPPVKINPNSSTQGKIAVYFANANPGYWQFKVELWEYIAGIVPSYVKVDEQSCEIEIIEDGILIGSLDNKNTGVIVHFKEATEEDWWKEDGKDYLLAFKDFELVYKILQGVYLIDPKYRQTPAGLSISFVDYLELLDEVKKAAFKTGFTSFVDLGKDQNGVRNMKLKWVNNQIINTAFSLAVFYDRAMISIIMPINVNVIDAGGGDTSTSDDGTQKILTWMINGVNKQIGIGSGEVTFKVQSDETFTMTSNIALLIGPYQGRPGDIFEHLEYVPLIYDYYKWEESPSDVFWVMIGADSDTLNVTK